MHGNNPLSLQPVGSVIGEVTIAGDKSISHRAVMFSSLAGGESLITNLSRGEDVRSTLRVFQSLGIEASAITNGLKIKGRGFRNFIPPASHLDAGNSGTTARLMAGILIHQPFESEITGDESLSKRPMKRIAEPLGRMGGIISLTGDSLPMVIRPSLNLIPGVFELPVASAQLKSALLLSGLYMDEPTTVIEKEETRNHTELMLGMITEFKDGKKFSHSSRNNYPQPAEYFIPGDVSSAAFYIVLALLSGNSELRIKDVSLNPTRCKYIDILRAMGGDIATENIRVSNNEPYGDIIARSSVLKNIDIPESAVANIIDEIPILSIAGIFAGGTFSIRKAKELRVKESDRISAMVNNIICAGIAVEEYEDGFSFEGGGKDLKSFAEFASFGDHRIAMSFSILSFLLKDGGKIDNFSCVNISNPDFYSTIKAVSR